MTPDVAIDPPDSVEKPPETPPDFPRESSPAPRRLFALKHGDTFVAADARGDILGGAYEADGMFREDTRVLSRYRLTVGEFLPDLLGGALSHDSVFYTANV